MLTCPNGSNPYSIRPCQTRTDMKGVLTGIPPSLYPTKGWKMLAIQPPIITEYIAHKADTGWFNRERERGAFIVLLHRVEITSVVIQLSDYRIASKVTQNRCWWAPQTRREFLERFAKEISMDRPWRDLCRSLFIRYTLRTWQFCD